MKSRWFIVEVSNESLDGTIVGNCATKALAEILVDALIAQSNRIFKIVGPITENMIQGRLDPKDIELVEAQMEQNEYKQAGRLTH